MLDNNDIKIIDQISKKEIDPTDTNGVLKALLQLVPDPVTRSILFETPIGGTNDPEIIAEAMMETFSEMNIVFSIRKVISYAFVTTLTYWKKLYDDNTWGLDNVMENFKSSRYSKLFLSALGNEDINLDLQIFALIELWVGLGKADPSIVCQFGNIFQLKKEGGNIGINLQTARDLLKKTSFRTLNGGGKYDLAKCTKLLYQLVVSFPFLRIVTTEVPDDPTDLADDNIKIIIGHDVITRIELYPNMLYDIRRFLMTKDQLRAYTRPATDGKKYYTSDTVRMFMLSETTPFDDKYSVLYRSFDGEDELSIELPEVHLNAQKYSDEHVKELRDISEMRKFLTFNYKNIREFAAIISDALSVDCENAKWRIFEYCKEKNAGIISDDVDSIDSDKFYLDNVITLALVEMGPSELLEQILGEEKVFNLILQNIERRQLGHDAMQKIREGYKQSIASLRNRSRDDGTFEAHELALRIRTVLTAMGFDEDDSKGLHPFEESLSFKYANIKTCLNALSNPGDYTKFIDNIDCLSEIFRNIFIFLQVFYTGLDQYSISKQLASEENANSRESRRETMKAFDKAAIDKYIEIREQTLTESFEAFCKLCEEYDTSVKRDFKLSEKSKHLNYLITRNYICDVNKLRFFATIERENGTSLTIFEMLQNFNHSYTKDPHYKDWITYFNDVFMFLIYNDDYNRRGLYLDVDKLEDKDCDPIYPYLVTYYSENVDRDNLRRCTYQVPAPIGYKGTSGFGFTVNLLSEEEYVGKSYFCIPLKYGSSANWWINPFMVPRGFVQRLNDKVQEIDAKKEGI